MRVIAGEFKGRRLNSLKGDNTRPTSDKIKGSIFNMIGPYFDEKIVLDLFSGSGNLAIEAISRGCKEAYCFDNNFKAVQIIKENVALTTRDSAFTIKKMDAEKGLIWLKEQGITVDIIFLDPPYAKQELIKQLETIQVFHLLNDTATIVCEMDKKVDMPEEIGLLRKRKEQMYGITKVVIYRYEEDSVGES
ncbi:MAG: 16S rRNA (guanine(966)-N(2))-methyltransferase RsmD [Vagococcus sp.]